MTKERKEKSKKRVLWLETHVDDLVDEIILKKILETKQFKVKLLMTNVKNKKNSQYYYEVINEMKERCEGKGEEFKFFRQSEII